MNDQNFTKLSANHDIIEKFFGNFTLRKKVKVLFFGRLAREISKLEIPTTRGFGHHFYTLSTTVGLK